MRGMKKTTICKVISSKINHWTKSIDDEALRQDVMDSYMVTGGCITSMLLGEEISDFDVYIQDPNVAIKLCQYYLRDTVNTPVAVKLNSTGDGVELFIQSFGVVDQDISDYLDKNKLKTKTPYAPVMITTNAISLNNQIQIITRFTGTPEQIHSNFDFIHCTNYYTPKDGLVLNVPALQAILSKELKYVGSKYPICSVFRLRKFIKREWTITAGEILKICWDISKLDLEDMTVFREQTTGVDSAYFSAIINILRRGDRPLDRTYLVELIDRIWDDASDDFVEPPAEMLDLCDSSC